MKPIESLSDLFESVQCKATYFDLGRHIQKLTPQEVIQFDRMQAAYPYPFRQHASLAIVLQPSFDESPQNNMSIWFIRLPIDEKGSINLGTRDHFIKSIVDKILHNNSTTDLSNALTDNPYAFQPDTERMANFHAVLAKRMQQEPSHYFTQLIDYLSGKISRTDNNWESIGLQGIADLAVRANEDNYRDYIKKALKLAPIELASALAKSLEHQQLDEEYLHFIVTEFQESTNIDFKASLIRAASRSAGHQKLSQILQLSLISAEKKATDGQLQLVVALVAKCPHWLAKDPELLHHCMENLAQRDDGFHAFSKVATELTHTPEVKDPLWHLFKNKGVSIRLAQGVANLFRKTNNNRLQ
ncbi:DUF3549 family protein [Marinomonas algicola]|uniref:DUF3549 family protein n=1 Tax=Marinomonas algicola TaxID=2773454 RepID=UPI00174C795D|nr:DUF3549 family protein [Marinomonas algicola]